MTDDKPLSCLEKADLVWEDYYTHRIDRTTALQRMVEAFNGGITIRYAADMLVRLSPPTGWRPPTTAATTMGMAPNHMPPGVAPGNARTTFLDQWLTTVRGFGDMPRPPDGHDIDHDRIGADYLNHAVLARPDLPEGKPFRDGGIQASPRIEPRLVPNHIETGKQLSPETLARMDELLRRLRSDGWKRWGEEAPNP